MTVLVEGESKVHSWARINHAFASMPFGGICHFDRLGDKETEEERLVKIAGNLENLAEVLTGVGNKMNRDAETLRTLDQQFDALADVFLDLQDRIAKKRRAAKKASA